MKKSFLTIILLMLSIAGFVSIDAKADVIATFADPSNDGNDPLFTINFMNNTLNGKWDNAGLLLYIHGNPFPDAWFEMTEVTITPFSMPFGTIYPTGSGTINFYENGSSTPLMVIEFDSGLVVPSESFGANEMLFSAAGVTITVPEIAGKLSEEIFTFNFANLAKLPGHPNWNDGFTATASFDSSAVVPEPATICILGLGALSLIRRKKLT